MIHKLGQVMLYVSDQNKSVNFWIEKLGFVVVSDQNNGHGLRWIEISPSLEAETSIVLHNKSLIAEMQPELNLNTPSLLFYSENITQFRDELLEKNVKVGDLVEMPTGKVFNFADDEDNYFAVLESK